jgi:hypothetical protein
MAQQICLPQYVGVPFQNDPPTVDGYVEPEPAMVWTFGQGAAEVDVGWTGASRITYGDATDTGPSGPLVALQGVSDLAAPVAQRRLWLSFVVRRDPSFSTDDRIIVVLHPNFAAGSVAKTGDERRIDIWPLVTAGAGAGGPDQAEWGMQIKKDRPPEDLQCFRWDVGDGAWRHVDKPTGLRARVRSWTTAGGSNNWSVELEIPNRDPGVPADAWIDLTNDMGLFADVVRVSTPPGGSTFVTQFVWPRGAELDDGGGLFDLAQLPIEPSKLGQAHVGPASACSGVRGVSFDGGWASIGARPPGSGAVPGSHIQPGANEFVARLRNTGGTVADGVRAEFRIANWGIGPGDSPLWNKLGVASPHHNPTAPVSLPAADLTSPSTGEATTQWTPSSGDYGGALHTHQCIWVLLSSNQSVDFVRASMKRNMDIVGLSEHDRDVHIDGRGWADDEEGADLDLLLIETQVAMTKPRERKPPIIIGAARIERPPIERDPDQPRAAENDDAGFDQVFVTVVDGYRRTDRTLTIDGKRLPLYSYTDSFGQIGVHSSTRPDRLEVELRGPDLRRLGPGAYQIAVPKSGAVKLGMHLETVPADRPGPEPPHRGKNWFVRLIRLILELLKRAFRSKDERDRDEPREG